MVIDKELDLSISRHLDLPRARLWQAWSKPEHLKEWWCPKPWTTEVLAFDFRTGGAFHTLMRGPGGETSDNPGVFLDVVPESRIVWTNALGGNWRPLKAPWLPMTAVFTLEEENGGTRYTATALHPDRATRDEHEKMGFYEGWGICVDQLAAFAASLR